MANEDSLPPDRAIRIATAIESIERDLNRLFDLQNGSLADYLDEGNQDTRDIVERRFETLTEATLDVARQLIKQEGQRVPARRQAVIDTLEDLDIVDAALAEKLGEAVAFRDVLAHTYGPVIDDELVYEALTDDLDRYVSFVQAVNRYVARFDD